MSSRREDPRNRETDAEGESGEDSKERHDIWHRGRPQWRRDNRQDDRDRSISPEAKPRLLTRGTENLLQRDRDGFSNLSQFWRRQKATPRDVDRYGGPHPDTMDPPMVGWRQAKVHVWTRPVSSTLQRKEEQNSSNLEPRKADHKNQIKTDQPTLEAAFPKSESLAKSEITEKVEPLLPLQHVSEMELDIGPTPKARKTRKDIIAEVKARYPEWVHRADKDPQWYDETKRKQAERTAREQRDFQRLEEWRRQGPVPRCAFQNWRPGRPGVDITPYPEPSDEDLVTLQMALTNSSLCSVSMSEPYLVSVNDGYRLVYPPDEDSHIRRVKVAMKNMAANISLHITPGQARKTLGHHADYLSSNGTLELVGLRDSDLDRNVHPIFHPDNFHNVPNAIYEILLPAMRLASNFIMHPACLSWWLSLFYGRRVADESASMTGGVERQRVVERASFTLELAQRLQREVLLPLSRNLHFVFGWTRWDENPTERVYAATDRIPFNQEPEQGARETRKNVIYMCEDWYTAARRFLRLRTGHNTAERLRFNFLLATTITHEIAHAAHFRQVWVPQIRDNIVEPFFLDDKKAELGFSWSRDMFGGFVQSIEARSDGLFGVEINVPDQSNDPFGGLQYSVPMGFIEELQQRETWDRLASLQDYDNHTYFRIPLFTIPAYQYTNMVMREPLAKILNRQHESEMDGGSTNKNEEQLIEPLLPIDRTLLSLSLPERRVLLMAVMQKPNLTEEDILIVWELWWQYESIGFSVEVEQERKWHLAENYWRLSGGKSSRFISLRMANDPDFLPERFDPRVMGSWSEAEMAEFLRKRQEKLGIPISVPWDKYEDNDSDNSDDTPPHLRTEFGHHPGGNDPPESPFQLAFKGLLRNPGESPAELLQRINTSLPIHRQGMYDALPGSM